MRTLLTYLLGAALVGSILTNCATHHRLQAERLAHQTCKDNCAKAASAAERVRADEEANRRKAEQELRHAQDAHAQEVAALHLDLDRARAAGRVASERLRSAASDVAQRASQVCADSTSAELRQAASDAIGVLGRVLAEIDDYAGVVAEFADRSRVAGLACEREYEAAREKLKGLH